MATCRIGNRLPRVSVRVVFCPAKASPKHGVSFSKGGTDRMSIKRYGAEGGKGTGGQHLPFARAVEADGWLYVSGQVPMMNGEVVAGNVVAQSHQAIRNLLSILAEAGYGLEHVVRCGVWLDDPRDFQSFNQVFREYFGENPPARACVVSSMVVDCKVELDCVAYKKPGD